MVGSRETVRRGLQQFVGQCQHLPEAACGACGLRRLQELSPRARCGCHRGAQTRSGGKLIAVRMSSPTKPTMFGRRTPGSTATS